MKLRLNEALFSEEVEIRVPVQVKFRTTSPDEDSLIIDLKTQLLDVIQDELEYKLDNDLYPTLQNYAPKISQAVGAKIEINHLYLNLEPYNSVLNSKGDIELHIVLDEPADSGALKNSFNTVLNNNIVWQEITIPFEDEEYGEFDIIVEIEKTGEVEVEGDNYDFE